MSRASIVIAMVCALLVLALGVGAMLAVTWYLLPKEKQTAPGLRIDGATVPEGRSPADYVRNRAKTLTDRRVSVQRGEGESVVRTLSDLGVRVDLQTTLRRAMNVGRQGSLLYRLDASWRARAGLINVPLALDIDPSPTVARLVASKEVLDLPAVPARYDLSSKQVAPHRDGQYIDVYATVDALDKVVRSGEDSLKVVVTSVPPLITASFLLELDISQRVGYFETRFGYLGRQANRAHNIATAASRLDGVVMLPLQVISFNKIVGHRTLENGFSKGWEIFKGEMVQGVGGGTCQVASTLHAAAYLAGMDVIERAAHSRPSSYIAMGLDATVVDGLVDLKLRNPFDFPVVIHSRVDKGLIRFELLGERRPLRVTFRGDVVRSQPYKRRVREAQWLDEGRVIRKQRGIRGYTVKRSRTMRSESRTWEEVSMDNYPPTAEIFLVPPGIDADRDLPPLPFEVLEPQSDEEEQPELECEPDCEPVEAPTIVNGPAARQQPPSPSRRVVIDR